MKKEERKIVYDKYNGHCAYCGKKIDYKEMQVDHLIPKRTGTLEQENNDNIEAGGALIDNRIFSIHL